MKDVDNILKEFSVTESGSSAAWMMTLADLLSLLLVFFILIYSMSSVRQGEWEKVIDSIGDAFSSDKVVEEGAYSTQLGINRVNIEVGMDLDYLYAVLSNKVVSDDFLSSVIDIKNNEDNVVVSLDGVTAFEGNTPVMTEDAQVAFFVVGEALQKVVNKIEVFSYLDKKKFKLADWELSLKRAVEVAAQLREYGNLSRMDAKVNFDDPSDDEPDGKDNKNGRIDIVIRDYTKELTL